MFRGRRFVLLDQKFLRQKRRYVAQAFLAAFTLAVVLAVLETLTNVAIITAIASSAFIVFMTPHSTMARPRRVVGGHFVGAAIGLVVAAILDVSGKSFATTIMTDIFAAGAVETSMLVMAATDTEHPPAAGTVLGTILGTNVVGNAGLVLVAAACISLARVLFGRWMINLADDKEESPATMES